MSLLLYITFILLIGIVFYYFIYLNNLDYNSLYIIILNFIFLIVLPLYFFYFKDFIYSLITSFALVISSFIFNLKIKEIFRRVKIFPLIYFNLCLYFFYFILITNFL